MDGAGVDLINRGMRENTKMIGSRFRGTYDWAGAGAVAGAVAAAGAGVAAAVDEDCTHKRVSNGHWPREGKMQYLWLLFLLRGLQKNRKQTISETREISERGVCLLLLIKKDKRPNLVEHQESITKPQGVDCSVILQDFTLENKVDVLSRPNPVRRFDFLFQAHNLKDKSETLFERMTMTGSKQQTDRLLSVALDLILLLLERFDINFHHGGGGPGGLRSWGLFRLWIMRRSGEREAVIESLRYPDIQISNMCIFAQIYPVYLREIFERSGIERMATDQRQGEDTVPADFPHLRSLCADLAKIFNGPIQGNIGAKVLRNFCRIACVRTNMTSFIFVVACVFRGRLMQ